MPIELIKTFTPEGLSKIREILKDPLYQRKFFEMLGHELRGLPIEYKRGVVFELQLMLQNGAGNRFQKG